MKLSPRPARSLDQAACKGANPGLFDAIAGDLVFDALSYCERCKVTTECFEYVAPSRSYFDGVAAGRLWRNGVETDPVLFSIEGE